MAGSECRTACVATKCIDHSHGHDRRRSSLDCRHTRVQLDVSSACSARISMLDHNRRTQHFSDFSLESVSCGRTILSESKHSFRTISGDWSHPVSADSSDASSGCSSNSFVHSSLELTECRNCSRSYFIRKYSSSLDISCLQWPPVSCFYANDRTGFVQSLYSDSYIPSVSSSLNRQHDQTSVVRQSWARFSKRDNEQQFPKKSQHN